VLGPFDYEREAYTRLLWFHEGFTEYMESIVLLRAGVIDAETYVDALATEWPRFANRPGRRAPLSELSFEAWIKQYKPADNFTNRSVSYYEKGKWVALLLELELRKATRGRRGVPDLFRVLWRRHGRKGEGIGYEDVRRAADEIAGRSLAGFFRRYVDGTDELPVPAALRAAGLDVSERAPGAGDDDGIRARRAQAWIGVALAGGGNDRAIVRNVMPESPAFAAGLTYGDELVAIDGFRVNAGTAPKRLADARPGQSVTVAFFRQDALRTTRVKVARDPSRTLELALAERPAPPARAIRRGWLGA
jgi:predicted metalloprotease with PDZ domain